MRKKCFGGYLSLRQMLYLVLGISSAGILFIPVIPMLVKLIVFFSIFTMFIAFAFLRIGANYVDKCFLNILKYLCRKKIYINER